MTTLLVASTGGHLTELHHLLPRLDVTDRCWATFDAPQSRSLLADEDVVFVPPATSRDPVSTFRDYLVARGLFRQRRFSRVISTGSSVAMAFFVPATAAGIECYYIESATRTGGPSLTGRLVARLPRTHLYTQHRSWADGRWQYGGSIFDAFLAERRPHPRPVRRVVVTLGIQPKYAFPRLLNRLVAIIPPSAQVLWQVGDTQIDPMPPGARRMVPLAELHEAMREADVVITHAGVGSALGSMRAGHRPICVPRLRSYREQVDDHQVDLARELDGRALVFSRDADAISEQDLQLAAAWSVMPDPEPAAFRLAEPCR
ncbi:MAG TPA: glycosyltransferase [Micromonosporaceae bacterium]|nr:glycosyltransferase [Micromonosporaceae bacterium]